MYALEMLLVSWGILAFRRALESPTARPPRTVRGDRRPRCSTRSTGRSTSSLVVGVLLVALAWRSSYRHAARRMLIAMVVGGLAFVPWLPTFLYQRAHTGTPWGTAQLPGIPIGTTLRDFAGGNEQEGWILMIIVIGLLVLGLFGRATDGRRIELDLHTRARCALGGADRRRHARGCAHPQLCGRRCIPIAVQRARVPLLHRGCGARHHHVLGSARTHGSVGGGARSRTHRRWPQRRYRPDAGG